jgi:hypothetical protein
LRSSLREPCQSLPRLKKDCSCLNQRSRTWFMQLA